jgi:HTH-type transcriptional regulator/antitoxin HipB
MTSQIARTPAQLGAALRRHRKALGLSQGQLAEQVSLRQGTISALEAGAPGTKLQTVLDALSALGLELVVRPRTTASMPDVEDLY